MAKVTKAELEKQVKSLERQLNTAKRSLEQWEEDAAIRHEMYGDLEVLVNRAEKAERERANSIEEKTGLTFWVSSNEVNPALNIGSGRGYGQEFEAGFSMAIYYQDAQLMGVIIGDTKGNTIATHGYIPGETVIREIRYARGERITI